MGNSQKTDGTIRAALERADEYISVAQEDGDGAQEVLDFIGSALASLPGKMNSAGNSVQEEMFPVAVDKILESQTNGEVIVALMEMLSTDLMYKQVIVSVSESWFDPKNGEQQHYSKSKTLRKLRKYIAQYGA